MVEVDELYAVKPEEFVAARNALVKELKAAGTKDEAAAVAKLRRPTPTAWALNQVARNHPDLLAAALDAGERLRAASDDAMAGRPEGLREATAAERTAGAAVAKVAGELLGARASSLQSAVLGTLRVAALDAAVADELRRGVLTTEHEQPGFGFGLDLGDGPVAERTPRPAAKPAARPRLRAVPDLEPDDHPDDDAERAAAIEAAKAERAAAREAERRRKKEQAARQRTADRLAKEASRLAREADDAEALAVEARQRADDARHRADQAAEAVRALDPD